MILLSSLKLSVDTYINFDSHAASEVTKQTISLYFDYLFTAFFSIEAFLKIIAYGFIMCPNSYLRDNWSRMDFVIVVSSILDISSSSINLSFVKIVRMLRTLRPLRFITTNKQLKCLVLAIIESIGGLFNVFAIIVLIWAMFSIAGMSFFKGKMNFCGQYAVNFYLSEEDCIAAGLTWSLHYLNFENILYGLKVLFIYSTIEGWPDYVYWFIDSDKVLCKINNHKEFGIFFMIFLAVSAFFLMNLFTAIVSLNYSIALEKLNKNSLNEPQQNWFDTLRLIQIFKPDFNYYLVPKELWTRKIFFLIKSKYFDSLILLAIVANAIVLEPPILTPRQPVTRII